MLLLANPRGKKLGNGKQAVANRIAADAYAERLRPIVMPFAGQPLRVVAKHLNDCGIKTARGRQWQPTTSMRLLDRLGLR